MQRLGLACIVIIGIGLPAAASAQSPLEGPLAAPAKTPKEKPAKAKTAHRKAKTAKHEASKPVAPTDSSSKEPEATIRSHGEAPADPVSFGMKWSGSNDNARDTRVQNYDGSAAGNGGEVGFKLHF